MGNKHSKTSKIKPNKVIPPISHIIEPDKLKVGDHIYRRLCGIKAVIGYHHGIVTEVTEPYTNNDEIKILEMTSENGIQINTLTNFLKGWDCRLVYYNSRKLEQIFHASGTCHVETSSPIHEIKQRIKDAMSMIDSVNNSKMYSLFGTNCEEFAVWIKLGIYKGVKMSQIKNFNTMVSSGVSAVSFVVKYADDIATTVATTAKNTAKNATNTTSKTVATEVAENTAKYTARGIGCGIGVAVGIEAICTGYTVWKYKTDYTYTQCDMWRDLGRSWMVTALCTGIGIALLPIGWWAILPAAAIGIFTKWIFDKFDVFDGKTYKEKVYIEYGLNENSSVKELRSVRKKIRRDILNEKLHPDKWSDDLKDDEKPKKYEKYLWLTAILEMLEEDIQNGSVTFNNEEQKQTNQIEYKKIN